MTVRTWKQVLIWSVLQFVTLCNLDCSFSTGKQWCTNLPVLVIDDWIYITVRIPQLDHDLLNVCSPSRMWMVLGEHRRATSQSPCYHARLCTHLQCTWTTSNESNNMKEPKCDKDSNYKNIITPSSMLLMQSAPMKWYQAYPPAKLNTYEQHITFSGKVAHAHSVWL